jgi:hypothetical protein
MNKSLPYLILTLLNINCYLSDLEGYKHLEKHENDIFELYPPYQTSTIQSDSVTERHFTLHSNFSIKRTIYFSFYDLNETPLQSSLIYLKNNNGILCPVGEGYSAFEFRWLPDLCSKTVKIKALAISDVDTLESSVHFNNEMYFHCRKGGVDSFSVNISFGNDSNTLSIIKPLQYCTFDDIDYSRNPVIISKFSRLYNKSFIMMYSEDFRIDSMFKFIQPRNIDSLEKLNPVLNCSFFESECNSAINRDVLCDIWMKYNHTFSLKKTIQEISIGKKYAIVYPIEMYNDYIVFLLRIDTITYSSTLSGRMDCTLFTLN